MSVRKSQENYRQIYGKSKASLYRSLRTGTPPKLFRTILCFVALVYHKLIFFFRTAVLLKLHDIRFSYKHCNFSHVCILVKMALKTLTRSIAQHKMLFSKLLDISEVFWSLRCILKSKLLCLQSRLKKSKVWNIKQWCYCVFAKTAIVVKRSNYK